MSIKEAAGDLRKQRRADLRRAGRSFRVNQKRPEDFSSGLWLID
jgi:hypothetical protein